MLDVAAIQEECWQTCDADSSAYAMDLTKVPVYRDPDTRRIVVHKIATMNSSQVRSSSSNIVIPRAPSDWQ